jgi:hypothetical protein
LWDNSPDRYHVINARAFLNAGGFQCFRGVVTAFYPMLSEMLYLPLFYFSEETVGTLIHNGFGLLILPGLYCLGHRLGSPRAGLLAGLFYYGCSMTGRISPLAYNDLVLTFYGLMVFYCFCAFFENHQRHWLLMAGGFAGAAVSAKLLGGLYIVFPSLILSIWALIRGKTPRFALVKTLMGAALLGILVYLPWAVRNALCTGSPFFPFLSSVIPFELAFSTAAEQFHSRHSLALDALVDRPWGQSRRYFEIAATEGFTPVILLPFSLIYIVLSRKGRRPANGVAAFFAVFSFIALIISNQIRLRFFVVALPPMAWLSATLVDGLLGWLRSNRWLEPVAAVLMVLLFFFTQFLFPVAFAYRGHAFKVPPFLPHQRRAQIEQKDHTRELVRALNETLDQDDLVLLEKTQVDRFRTLEIPFIPYAYFGPPLRVVLEHELKQEKGDFTPEDLREKLIENGITHILLGPAAEEHYEFPKELAFEWKTNRLYDIRE